MTTSNGYPTAAGVEQAIKEAARAAVKANPGSQVSDLIRQTYFDRSLSRVFSEGSHSNGSLRGELVSLLV